MRRIIHNLSAPVLSTLIFLETSCDRDGDSRTIFGATTKGGIFKATSLDRSGPGTLNKALETEGERLIVFEVGGVIDLKGEIIIIDDPRFNCVTCIY